MGGPGPMSVQALREGSTEVLYWIMDGLSDGYVCRDWWEKLMDGIYW